MSFDVVIDSVNVNDDVRSCDPVPVIDRNRDWTLVEYEFKLQVVDNVTVAKGDTVLISEAGSSYPFFKGIVMEKKQNKNNREKYFDLRVAHYLTKLKDIIIDYDTFHTLLSTGATSNQYIASDNNSLPNVQVLWFLEKALGLAGISVDFSNIENQLVEVINYDAANRNILVQHLVLDENMLYCINHDTAAFHTIIDTEDYASQKWSVWDFFSQFVSWIGVVSTNNNGFTVRWTQIETDTPEEIEFLVRDDTLITFNDDDKLEDNPDQSTGEKGGFNYNPRYANNRAVYNTASASALVDHKFGLGKNTIDFPTNLVSMYRKFWGSAGDIVEFPDYCYPAGTLIYNHVRAKVDDFDIFNFKAPYPYTVTVPARAKQILINTDVRDVSAYIIQEDNLFS